MPETIKKYKIFVASPSDVTEERDSINEVINELNLNFSPNNNLILELIKWETHTAPGASSDDVQTLIDQDIGADYDLFIGILWKKFGTKTRRFGSGTEQEFMNAYSRFCEDSSKLQILFYFKDEAPKSLSDINPLELGKINEFKRSLQKKDILYNSYNTISDLHKYLRLHIPHRIQDLQKGINEVAVTKETPKISSEIQEENDLGILDYNDLILEGFEDSTSALQRITGATEWVGKEIEKKTAEITKKQQENQTLSNNAKRDFFRRTAEVLNNYEMRIEGDIPLFFENYEKGSAAFVELINLHSDHELTTESEIIELETSLDELISGIQTSIDGMNDFVNELKSLPKYEKNLNKAKRQVESKLDDLLHKLEVSESIANELINSVDKLK